jgi:glycosyltransferase involved in cell wall biosynthesis
MVPEQKCWNVLVIPPSENLASYQIGIRQPLEELKRRGLVQYQTMEEGLVTDSMLSDFDTVVFLRNTSLRAYRLMNRAKQAGKQTVYSIDDHFLHLPPNRGFGAAMKEPERRATFIQFLTNAQLVRVGSPFFAEHIRASFNRRVVCIEAGVDFAWIDQADASPPKDEIVIGYEGSVKEDDFTEVIPALKQVLKQYGRRVRMEFHNYIPEALEGHRRVKLLPGGYEYRAYLHVLASSGWSIGLAPLRDTLYNRCKSNNKYREYSACSIAGIYSDIPTYSDCVSHRETGLLVPHDTEGWLQGLQTLIENDRLREHIRKKARREVRKRYTIERCADGWLTHILRRDGG